MAFQLDTSSISHQLVVGKNYPMILGLGPNIIRGSTYLESPTVIGNPNSFPNIQGSLMVGPMVNEDSPPAIIPGSICGTNFSPYSLSVVGDASIFDNLSVNNIIVAGGNIIASGEVLSQCGEHILSNKKNFDIKHPSKPNWRLRHTCLEGPENGVYIRGKVKEQGKFSVDILFPEYWSNFIDHETITVSITPFDTPQNLYYKLYENKIVVHSSDKRTTTMKFDYQIFAERSDGEKLIPEYEGLTPDHYPGNNSEYSIVGWTYDKRKSG